MIQIPLLADAIRNAGPAARSLSALEKTPTSHATVGILVHRVGCAILEEHYGEHFDLFVCEDHSSDAVRIPGQFAILCLDSVGVKESEEVSHVCSSIDTALRELDLHHSPCLLLTTGALEGFGPLLIYPGSKMIDFQPAILLRLLLAFPPRSELMRHVVRKLPLQALNPYIYKGPVGANLFFGRTRQIEQLCSSDASFCLIGPRAMGKTSLMRRACQKLLDEGRIAVQCEFGSALSEADLFRQIFREFIHVHGCSPHLISDRRKSASTLESLVQGLARKHSQPVVIFIDEADELTKRCPTLTQCLKVCHDKNWLRFVLVGHKELRRATSDVQRGALMNVIQRLDLTALDHADAAELARKPMTSLHIQLDNPDRITKTLLRESGGSPSKMQLICHFLVEYIARSGYSNPKVTAEDVENAMRLPEVRAEVNSWYRYSTSPLEKWLAAIAVSILPASESDVIKAAQASLPEISSLMVQDEINDLVVANVLDYQKDGMIDFAFPAMKSIASLPTEGKAFMHDLRNQVSATVRNANLVTPK